ncbi:MAG TPA: M20/M25/M40 family metallo-hydrolase [Geminicoccaceae bacterium]|nr:M20/M25/M40 family metallo-hydrolase [Geminicoccus sp.]HMU49378.1 M20/M25/M40 family metallo-hydrolase [Geminicoccaceae bacterium]
MHRSTLVAASTVAAIALLGGTTAQAVPGFNADSSALRAAITDQNIRAHMVQLDRLARIWGGTRVDATRGYDASVNYVRTQLRRAGYTVRLQPFDFYYFEENADPILQRTAPTSHDYSFVDDYYTMTYSGAADVTGSLVAVNNLVLPPGPEPSTSSAGCAAGDFVPAGANPAIALIQRGTCDFVVKAANAQAAGYDGVLIFNEGQPGRTDTFGGTLGGPGIDIPVVGTSFAVGNELAGLLKTGPVTLRLAVDATTTPSHSTNVLADTPGRGDRIIVVGAHLDSVAEGPGINDNGSGTAGILEIAIQMAKLGIEPRNRVRFAFWGAEEFGLFGSQYYVDTLTDQQYFNTWANLNFDMIASPNFARFVYDGDGSEFGLVGPPGSDIIEAIFEEYFGRNDLANEPTAFDGRSDYFAFINVGIPSGGLFTGAEEIKSAEQVDLYGGTAGVAFDPCYHQACDDIRNNNRRVLGQMTDAAANTVFKLAQSSAEFPSAQIASRASGQAAARMDRRGSRLVR